MRFVHTADWHLGARLNAIGPRSSESLDWRFDAVRNVFDLSLKENASFILAAGDIFDNSYPGPDIRKKAAELFKDSPVPLYLMPGNHDPLTPGSIWTNPAFLDELTGLKNVLLLLSPEPVEETFEEKQVTLLPAPVTFKNQPADTSAAMDGAIGTAVDKSAEETTGNETRIRIGIAHGGLQNYFGTEILCDWIPENRADLSGLDYLALGDYHGYTPDTHPAARCRTRYSGAPEPLAVDQERAGYALLVEINEPGGEPVVTPFSVGKTTIETKVFHVSPQEGFDKMKKEIREIESPARTLLRCTVRGVLSVTQYSDYRKWMNGLYDEFLGIIEDSKGLSREPSDEEWEDSDLGLNPIEKRLVKLLQSEVETERFTEHEGGLVAYYGNRPSVRKEALALLYEQISRRDS